MNFLKNGVKILRISKLKHNRGKHNSAKSAIKSLIFAGMNPDGEKSKFTTIKN